MCQLWLVLIRHLSGSCWTIAKNEVKESCALSDSCGFAAVCMRMDEVRRAEWSAGAVRLRLLNGSGALAWRRSGQGSSLLLQAIVFACCRALEGAYLRANEVDAINGVPQAASLVTPQSPTNSGRTLSQLMTSSRYTEWALLSHLPDRRGVRRGAVLTCWCCCIRESGWREWRERGGGCFGERSMMVGERE